MTDNRALLNLDAIPSLFDYRVAPLRELHALGISTHTIHERCREGGPWQRLEPNLVLLTDEPPNRKQRIHAALKAAGEKAVLTGVDALRLHGMSGAKLKSSIHILVPARRQPGLVDGVYFERTHQLPDPVHLAGFPVAPLARATVDTCRRANQPDHVEDVLAESIYKGKLTPATLRDELDRSSGRGIALPRKKLAEIDDNVRSVAQGWAKRLVKQARLPIPEWRVPITSQNDTHIATTDAWWDEVGLAWEVDSYAFDLSPADATAALARAARLTAHGVLVVHTTPTELRDNPSAVADLLRNAYERAADRPRPEVRAQCKKTPKPSPTPKPEQTPKPEAPPESDPTPESKPTMNSDPAQEPEPTPEPEPAPELEPTPDSGPTPKPEPTPEPNPPQEPQPTPDTEPTQEPQPTPDTNPTPKPEPTQESQTPTKS
jgi:hypothetical protein